MAIFIYYAQPPHILHTATDIVCPSPNVPQCARLLSIEFMDVAEQSLEVLNRMAKEDPGAAVRGGAIVAALTYRDFFPMSVQRVAASLVAHACSRVPSDCWSQVGESIPLMVQLLDAPDTVMVEKGCKSFLKLATEARGRKERLDIVCSVEVIKALCAILTSGDKKEVISPTVITTTLQALTIMSESCEDSERYIVRMIQGGIVPALRQMFLQSNDRESSFIAKTSSPVLKPLDLSQSSSSSLSR